MSIAAAPNRWLRGLKEAAVSGFASFMFGELVSAILALPAGPTALSTAFPVVATLGGTAFGFLHGAEV